MTTNLFDLNGKVSLISGASRGIGEAAALRMAQHGAHVVVSSRKAEACEHVVEKIQQQGGSAQAMACHIGDLGQMTALINDVKKQCGKLDILVNNAAANPYFGHILDTDLGAFDKTVEVNIRGYFFMSVIAGNVMKEQGGGVIINTASVNAILPGKYQGIYSITKAAVANMTKAFAIECGDLGIRCNAILPGLTKTKFAGALFEQQDIYNNAMKKIPMGRHAKPDEMAGTIVYLASDASSYTNGECVVVDGGLTISNL